MFPFEAPTTMSISGTTGSGKTTWLKKLLEHNEVLFPNTDTHKILYCYGVWQELFYNMEKTIPNLIFQEGLPSSEIIEEITKTKKHNIIILDDLMMEVVNNSEVELLFSRGSHHKNLTIIYINQNMFCQGKSARTITLNCHYIILFQNLRDCSQVQRLGQQIYPGQKNLLVESYKDALQKPYGYLVVDLSPRAEEGFRLRSNIFPGEDTIIYRPHGTKQ
jgi:adenylate kinase family enzyme